MLWLLALAVPVLLLPLVDMGDGDSSDDDGMPADPEPPTPGDDGTAFLVGSGEVVTGTSGNDVFVADPAVETAAGSTINAGAGDDIIQFPIVPGPSDAGAFSGEINGEAGNDRILVDAEEVDVNGGTGDDTISGEVIGGSEISGGAGDDDITITSIPGDNATITGDAGDDRLDLRTRGDITSLIASGGAGDDTIITDGVVLGGTGYVLQTDGGAGDDTLIHEVDTFLTSNDLSDILSPSSMSGGAGTDTFEIAAVSLGGVFSEGPDDPEEITTALINITDFAPQDETIEFDLAGLASNDSAAITVTEDEDAGTTTVTLDIEKPNGPDQEIVVTLNATGLTANNIVTSGGPVTPIAIL
ncbi:calcium-binding protein [Primorskyibacter sp. S187A]|uniref:calcium-binding protein n=1 Tax=Primorskyibacter sp. S187A TaxID=3415130 RepID=UPI003C7DF596